MKRATITFPPMVLMLAAALTGGCIGTNGADDLIAGTKSDAAATRIEVRTDLIPDETGTDPEGLTVAVDTGADTAATPAFPEELSPEELAVLQGMLDQLLSGAGTLDGGMSLTDPAALGLHRRDMALMAIDLLAQQGDLTPEQELILAVTRAYLSRDPSALLSLLLNPLTGSTGG